VLWTVDSDNKLKEAVKPHQNACEEQNSSRCKRSLVNLIATDSIITRFQVKIDDAETPHFLGRCDLSTRTYLQTFRRIAVPTSSGPSLAVKMKE